MLALHLLTAAVVAVAQVSAFEPGADYNLYKTTNLYNCTGHVPVSDVTAHNAADTLPQIAPSAGQGWEQWSLFMHGTFPVLLRWNQGDPTLSALSSAHFDMLLSINGTTIRYTVDGNLSYTDSEHVHKIAVGNNVLSWDVDALWFNVSVRVDGYRLTMDSFSATRDAFHPDVAFHNGLLDQSGAWFGSIPLIRGHVTGSLSTPTQENITLDGLTVLRHMFSDNPLPKYIDRYTGGTLWGFSTTFYDTHIFIKPKRQTGRVRHTVYPFDVTQSWLVHEAAYLARSIPEGHNGSFSFTWATYAATDDVLYTLSIDTDGLNASFSGCTSGNNVPFRFNASALAFLGKFTDAGGGVTTYWTLNGTTSAAAPNGAVVYGAVEGIFETATFAHTNFQLQSRRAEHTAMF